MERKTERSGEFATNCAFPADSPPVLRESDAPSCRPLDGAANFAPMAMLTTPGIPAPVPLEVAASAHARRRGLLGRHGIDGARSRAAAVHTLDAVRDRRRLCGRQFRVLAVRTMKPGAWGGPVHAPATFWRRRPGRWNGGAYGVGHSSRCTTDLWHGPQVTVHDR